MCNLCNGTHVIHEVDSFSIIVSCCPTCGPEPDEIWRARLENVLTRNAEKRGQMSEEVRYDLSRSAVS